MLKLRDIPLRRKLTITSVLSLGVALLLAGGAFMTVELVTSKDALVADLSRAAAMIGHNSAAALTFDDPASAAETLQSLGTDPHIVGAALYDRAGELFAQYQQPNHEQTFQPPGVGPAGYRFERDRLKLLYEFSLAGEPAGTVYIESDVLRLSSRMARYGLIGLVVMLISSGVAFMLAAKLQRSISGPLSNLTKAMTIVRTQNNYSVRATKQGNDELGDIIEGFNAMLDQIQNQDGALQEARDHLERRVEERTRELTQQIAERELAQSELERTHSQLVDASRQAGMAEIATNVLHNVGNVLNSVNVSAGVIAEQTQQSRVVNLPKLVALLDEHQQDLAEFLTADPQGKTIPTYLARLSEQLLSERQSTIKELESLRSRIDHIKGIVAMQQDYATVSGIYESTNAVDLLEDAVRINGSSLERHEIEIRRDYADVPALNSEKHKILQILVNLVRNAKDACKASERQDKLITMRVVNGKDRIKLSVIDNGVGIAEQDMTRIFAHGFTTKKGGHGFGLHSGALAARDLGGFLTAHSDGVERGAAFTLELPLGTQEPLRAATRI